MIFGGEIVHFWISVRRLFVYHDVSCSWILILIPKSFKQKKYIDLASAKSEAPVNKFII